MTQLAQLVRRPERFLNMHWLNPAYLIPVVELSTHPGTDAAVLARTRALMEGIGKLPVVCGPTPGYIVPRLQALIMNEAARMIEEGAATAEEIDKATRYGLGLRFAAIGVVEFIDFGGSDILHHASREMAGIGRRQPLHRAGHRRPDGGAGPPGREDRQRLLRLHRARHPGLSRATCWRARWRCCATPACGAPPAAATLDTP